MIIDPSHRASPSVQNASICSAMLAELILYFTQYFTVVFAWQEVRNGTNEEKELLLVNIPEFHPGERNIKYLIPLHPLFMRQCFRLNHGFFELRAISRHTCWWFSIFWFYICNALAVLDRTLQQQPWISCITLLPLNLLFSAVLLGLCCVFDIFIFKQKWWACSLSFRLEFQYRRCKRRSDISVER